MKGARGRGTRTASEPRAQRGRDRDDARPRVRARGGASPEPLRQRSHAEAASKPASAPRGADEETLYGLRCGLAVFEHRRNDILSVAFDPALGEAIEELTSWAVMHDIPLHEEGEKALAARAESNQHEGLVLTVKPRRWLPPKELGAWLVQRRALGVALDRVRNPQNIGAILRSAAFFGAGAALLGAPAPHPGLPAFAQRVAEGGAEHLVFSRTTDLADTLGRLRAGGVQVIGTDGHSRESLAEVELGKATLLVLGHEREGLSPRIRAQCDSVVGIQGAGTLDSLNVAVAAGVFLAELWRRRGSRPA